MSNPDPRPDELARLRKNVPSRQNADALRRVALALDAAADGGADAALLNRVADFLQDARQVLRGGALDVPVRHWNK